MSISKKIYSVIVILLLVAGIIFGVGFYSIGNLVESNNEVERISRRTINLIDMMRISYLRTTAVLNIIHSVNDEEKRKVAENSLKPTETMMHETITNYLASFPQPVPAAERANTDEIKKLWAEFVKISTQVTLLSMENPNRQATEIFNEMIPSWDKAIADLEQASDSLAGKSAQFADYSRMVRQAQKELYVIRPLLLQFIATGDSRKVDEYAQTLDDLAQSVHKNLAPVIQDNKTGEIGAMVATIQDQIEKNFTAELDKIVKIIMGKANIRSSELQATKGVGARTRFNDYASSLVAEANSLMAASMQNADQLAKSVVMIMVIVAAAGVLSGGICAYIVVSGISKSLNSVISVLNDSSEQVYTAARQISASSQSLADGATEQAASLEETSSALEQMASMTRQNADNTSKTKETMLDTGRQLQQGAEHMANMDHAMAEISQSSEQIARIIKTIEDIAFQTNLLALNAAVEAARAGEAGKGFAVVADEVRNLAQRSAQAARDTTNLIESTIGNVQNGVHVSTALGESFAGIRESVESVTRNVEDIAAATNEQAQGVDQVNTAVAQMDKVTQNNSAGAEQSAAAAGELTTQATNLRSVVGNLTVIVAGNNAKNAKQLPGSSMMVNARIAPPSSEPLLLREDGRQASGGVKMISASTVIPLDDDGRF